MIFVNFGSQGYPQWCILNITTLIFNARKDLIRLYQKTDFDKFLAVAN